MAERGFLKRKELPLQKHIYSIGPKGLQALVEEGIVTPELLGERLRTHELKDLFLKHEMLLVDIHTLLKVAARGTHLNLASEREGTELFDSVEFPHNGTRERLPVRPDAFISLETLPGRPGLTARTSF